MNKITLKTLSQASAQEVFDQVAEHLLTQNRKSLNEYVEKSRGQLCAYRGLDGAMCAAGCLIADDEYDADELELTNWDRLAYMGKVPKNHVHLIADLQYIHDRNDPDCWHRQLEKLANQYKLEFKFNGY